MSVHQASIVVLGDMNPAIYSAGWLRQFRVLDEEELAGIEHGNDAEVQYLIVANQVAQIPCRTVLLYVQADRLVLTSRQADAIPKLASIVGRVFGLLEHTPVTAFGINLDAQLETRGGSAMDRLQSLFVTDRGRLDRGFGADWKVHVRIDSISQNPRLQLTVSPSEGPTPGIALRLNSHYVVKSADEIVKGICPAFERAQVDLERLRREVLQ